MSFDVSKYTKSEWMKASDVPAEGMTVTVGFAKEHFFERDQETKPIISLPDVGQKLVLNKTRIVAMVGGFGDDPIGWEGKQIRLTTAPTQVGDMIVITPIQQQPPQQPPAAQPVPVAPQQPVAPAQGAVPQDVQFQDDGNSPI